MGEAIIEADWAVVPSESGSGHEGSAKGFRDVHKRINLVVS